MIIVGISGTNGAGKDTVSEVLVERHNFLFVSANNILAKKLKQQNLETTRRNKSNLSAAMRREGGLDVLIKEAVEMYEDSEGQYEGLVFSSMRHPAEAQKVNSLGGICVWVDADPETRYERITKNTREGRGVEDNIPFDQWLAEEKREMTPVGDQATLNISAVKPLCKVKLVNNQNDIDSFKDQVDRMLKERILSC